jgi:hypothetical protein
MFAWKSAAFVTARATASAAAEEFAGKAIATGD